MTSASDLEFVAFVQDASPRLLRTAWFVCGDPVQAEDLVQAFFEKFLARNYLEGLSWPRPHRRCAPRRSIGVWPPRRCNAAAEPSWGIRPSICCNGLQPHRPGHRFCPGSPAPTASA